MDKSVRNGHKRMRSLLSLWIAVAAVLTSVSVPARAAGGISKANTTHAIAIVFDNSGSMYERGKKAWCQATYAIEVFAAMMNQGDTLQVYPMNDIEVGALSYTKENPLVISDTSDARYIQDIYTPRAGDTHIEAVMRAYDGLLRADTDEKWLIVLTDGEVFYENGLTLAGDTKSRLSELLTEYNQEVNVLYLGIDVNASEVPEVAGRNLYSGITATSQQVPSALSGMCNLIFGRDELPQANQQNGQLTFDIPLSKLIVFVQGENLDNVTLTDAAGNTAGQETGSYSPHYSENGAGGNYTGKCVADTTLQGRIVTYTNCPAGTYDLSYTGSASSITAYYEPDVDLSVKLLDEEGSQVTDSAQFYPGTYRIVYGMVDSGGNTTNSPLLGKTDYVITYIKNGEEKTEHVYEAGELELELAEGDSLDAAAEVTFLSGYRISKTGTQLGWPSGGFSVTQRPIGNLSIRVSGGKDVYQLPELEEAGSYQIGIFYEGEQITGDKLDRTDVNVSLEGGNAVYDLSEGTDGYALNLKYAGSAQDTDCGPYTIHVSASYVNDNDQTAQSGTESVQFMLEDVTNVLTMEVEQDKKYFTLSQLDDADVAVVHLSLDGRDMTDAEMEQVQFDVVADQIGLKAELLPGQSAYRIAADPAWEKTTGKFRFKVAAAAEDVVGREISAEGGGSVELQMLPRWVYILCGLLIVFLVAFVIWRYLNAKRLPKAISAELKVFTVDGMPTKGKVPVSYSGGNKKKGRLQISVPKYPPNPMIKGGILMELEAASPRITKSASRTISVKKVTASNINAVNSAKIGSVLFMRSPDGKGLVKSGGRANAPLDIRVTNRGVCTITGEVASGDGGSATFTMVVALKYS